MSNMPVRKYRRDTSEVSCCLKYLIFGFNVLFWVRTSLATISYGTDCYLVQLLGLGILTVGVWAWSEKDTFNNLGKLANVALDPAFILICVGKNCESCFVTLNEKSIPFQERSRSLSDSRVASERCEKTLAYSRR